MSPRQSPNLESFLSSTGERYLLEDGFSAWRREPNLVGFDVSGNECHRCFEPIVRVLDICVASAQPQRVLFDNTACTDTSMTTYTAAVRSWMSCRERYQGRFEKLAAVVPPGMVGALLCGLSFQLDMRGLALKFFGDFETASQWVGYSASDPLITEVCRRKPNTDVAIVEDLHQLLLATRFSISVGRAARRLGMSERSLQRRLSRNQTTFQAEVCRAKLRLAKELMLGGELSLTAIAFELGFASPQHFSARFSAAHGEPPSSWLRSRIEAQSVSLVDPT